VQYGKQCAAVWRPWFCRSAVHTSRCPAKSSHLRCCTTPRSAHVAPAVARQQPRSPPSKVPCMHPAATAHDRHVTRYRVLIVLSLGFRLKQWPGSSQVAIPPRSHACIQQLQRMTETGAAGGCNSMHTRKVRCKRKSSANNNSSANRHNTKPHHQNLMAKSQTLLGTEAAATSDKQTQHTY
jgi:hypothetical protein